MATPQMTLEDIQGKKITTIAKTEGTYWVVLEDGSAVGFAADLRQVDTCTFQVGVVLHTLPGAEPAPVTETVNE